MAVYYCTRNKSTTCWWQRSVDCFHKMLKFLQDNDDNNYSDDAEAVAISQVIKSKYELN